MDARLENLFETLGEAETDGGRRGVVTLCKEARSAALMLALCGRFSSIASAASVPASN